MARLFLDNLRANINAAIPDNSVGEVSPADVRNNLLDMVDSTVPDETALTQSAPAVGIVLSPAWLTPLNQFDGSIGGDGNFLKPNPAGGYVEGSTTAGFSYYVLAETNIVAPNNAEISVSAGLDGVPFGPVVTLISGGDPLSASVIALVNALPSDGQVSLMYASSTSATITIDSAETLVIITPTNNP
jgi:hypothetical protein